MHTHMHMLICGTLVDSFFVGGGGDLRVWIGEEQSCSTLHGLTVHGSDASKLFSSLFPKIADTTPQTNPPSHPPSHFGCADGAAS